MAKQIYYIDINRIKRNTAGSKAKDDIADICKKNGYIRVVLPTFPDKGSKIYKKLWLCIICPINWIKLYFKIPKDAIVLYQHPMYGNRYTNKCVPILKKRKNIKFIAVVHDLESLRQGIAGVIENNTKTNEIADNMLLKKMDYVICHNEKMKKYLIDKGFDSNRLILLGIFDYLTNIEKSEQITPFDNNRCEVSIAGNLAIGKSGYIYELIKDYENNDKIFINLYGNNFDETKATSNSKWHGSFPAEKLPGIIAGNFGIIWDGPSDESCKGNTGEYLKYNNPHKTSLYLASGLPVIIWKQAAMADFILKNNLGIAVDSLKDISKAISRLSNEEYEIMRKNVEIIGRKLREGEYFTKAFSTALDKIENE